MCRSRQLESGASFPTVDNVINFRSGTLSSRHSSSQWFLHYSNSLTLPSHDGNERDRSCYQVLSMQLYLPYLQGRRWDNPLPFSAGKKQIDRDLLFCIVGFRADFLRNCRCDPRGPPKIVAIDLQPIGPVEGVDMIQGDITDEATARKVMTIFSGSKADLVVCDGAPDGMATPHQPQYHTGSLVDKQCQHPCNNNLWLGVSSNWSVIACVFELLQSVRETKLSFD